MIASHVQVCMYCAAEAERLEHVATAIRHIPVREPSALVVRIQRRKLLEEAARQQPTANRFKSGMRVRRLPVAYALVAAAAVVLALFGARRFANKAVPVAQPAPAPAADMLASEIEVRAMPETRWSKRSEPPVELIALEQGALWTKITHKHPHPPVLFRVPDGQIEDIGTTFTVAVQGGETQRVAVEDGAVLVRLRGLKEIHLSAGEVWERKTGTGSSGSAAPQPVVDSTPAPAPVEAQPPSDLVSSSDNAAQAAADTASADDQAAKAKARAKAAKKAAAAEHRLLKKGETALGAGHYSEAVRVFEKFDAMYPHSILAEDSAYLKALSFTKAGQTDDARAAAQDYLARFPDGFRQKEVRQLLDKH
jgi:hypothetical protein